MNSGVLVKHFNALVNSFFPEVCAACTQPLLNGEEIMCIKCIMELPGTDYWLDRENPLRKRFYGRVDLQSATALYKFKRGSNVQHLIHQLKYAGRQDVARYLGIVLGYKLKQITYLQAPFDMIIPLPLHPKKLKIRGYNQCDPIADGIGSVLQIAVRNDIIFRSSFNVSQTQKSRYDRWDNVSGLFIVPDKQSCAGKHILLVDDVVTTGSTAEACMRVLSEIDNCRVSFAAVATTVK